MAEKTLSKIWIFVIGLILLDLSLGPARAGTDDWSLCRAATTRLENQHQLPSGMISSISMVESGRRSPDGSLQAWPWTVNAEGRAYYFATRDAAVDAVRRMLAEGKRTIDVGCMQINLRYHPRAFTSVEEAFDPLSNVAYAAFFLRELEERSDNWDQAIGRYHSYSPALNARYSARVKAMWEKEQKAAALRARENTQEIADNSGETNMAPNSALISLRLSSYGDENGETDIYRPGIIRPTTLAAIDTASPDQ